MKWVIKENNEAEIKNMPDGYHPVVLQLMYNLGIKSRQEIENFFNFDYDKGLQNPFSFLEMKKAVARIISAKKNGEKIAIFGDYDADGVTSTALLCDTLKNLGFKDVVFYIPDRQLEGYGMNDEAVEFLRKEKVTLIITVDCGITSYEEIKKAKNFGIDVVVTDHHHVPKKIPEAVAVINPHIKNCGYDFQYLSGVGVAFKLAQALYKKIAPDEMEQLKWLLDLVAIGTIADCVPLLGENRLLAKYGLIVLSKTRRVGFLEMFKVGRITIDENNPPDARKVAFQISPRINAAGRMDHANGALNLIMEKNPVLARDLALDIETKNQDRQKITKEIVREIKIIAENLYKDKELIFAHNEHWPAGILGLVAGKIADEFHKPVAVFQKKEKEYVGSLRSIPQVNIIEALEQCKDCLIRFGGHPQAAGVTVLIEKMEEFYERLRKIVQKQTEGQDMEVGLEIDMEVKAEDINWDLMTQLKQMEPFGEGNREAVFLMKNVLISEIKIVGNGSKHLKLALKDGGGSPKIFDSIGFGMGEKFPQMKVGSKVDIVFNLQEDEWNGNKKMQLVLIDLKISA